MKYLILILWAFLLVGCDNLVTQPTEELDDGAKPSVTIQAVRLVFDFQCRYGGLFPEHTFRADVDPDTLEVTYELVANDSIVRPQMSGTFTDTLLVRWGGPREQRVEFVLSYEGWRVEGLTRCRVN